MGDGICPELRTLKVKGTEKSLSWNSIDNRHLATHTGACLTVGEEKFYICPSRFFGWSNNQINIKQINRRKTNLIRYVQGLHKNEAQGQVRQLKIICHPELRNGIGARSFKGDEDNSQDDKKNKCLVIKCSPCHTDR